MRTFKSDSRSYLFELGEPAYRSYSHKVPTLERTAQILLCLVVGMQYIEHIRFMPLTITQFLGFLLAGLFFLQKQLWKRPEPVFWYLFLFFLLYTFSVLFHLHEVPIMFQGYAIGKIFTLLQNLVLCYLSFCLFAKEQMKRYFISSIFIATLAISTFVLLDIGMTEKAGRFSFEELDENAMAIFIGLGIVTAIFLATNYKGSNCRLIALIAALPMVWFLVRTGSRGGMLATGAGIAAYFIRARKKLSWLFGIMIIVILLWQIFSSEISLDRWERSLRDGDTANREQILIFSWEQFKQRPWLGRGDVNAYIDLGDYFNKMEVGFHNELFWVLNSAGVVGGIFIFCVFYKTVQKTWHGKETRWQSINLAFLVMLGIACMSVEVHNRKIFWVILAFLLSGTLRKVHGQRTPKGNKVIS